MALCVDYSNARPSLAALKAQGFTGIARYAFAGSTNKNLGDDEIAECRALGLSILRVFEGRTDNPAGGAPQGREDAAVWLAHARAQGQPAGTAAYFAVDTDTLKEADVVNYFRGVVQVLSGTGYRIGIYGPKKVCERVLFLVKDVTLMWQTETWGGAVVSPQCNLYQRIGHTQPVLPGGGYDENQIITADYGQRDFTPTPEPDLTPAESKTLQDTANAVVHLTAAVAQLAVDVAAIKRGQDAQSTSWGPHIDGIPVPFPV